MGLEAFQTRVPGKWVLAGEHAVLRGGTAVALPHPELGMKLNFQPDTSGLRNSNDGLTVEPDSAPIRDLIKELKDRFGDEGRNFPQIRGLLKIESMIPIGAGLGSSAALCVALTRWLSEP